MEQETRHTHEIDVLAIIRKLLSEIKFLAVVVAVFAVIGVIVALNKQKSYTANVILAPEMSSGGLGLSETIGDMASTFGIDLGAKSGMDAIYPEIYPDIFSSTDFILTLLDVPVTMLNGEKKTYAAHLMKDDKTPFWSYPMKWVLSLIPKKKLNIQGAKKGRDVFSLSDEDYNNCNRIRGAISCMVDKKTSVITINVTDNDPKVAAIIADTLQNRLQKYIVDYRTKKSRNDFEYYKKLYEESKARYLKAQKTYAGYVDGNQDVVLQSIRSKQDDLENDMQLKFNMMNQMSTQMQAAKAKIQERTPAFTTIQSASIPHRASSTPRALIVLIWMFMGGLLGSLWVLYGRDWWQSRKKRK